MGLFFKKDLVYDGDKCQLAIDALEQTKNIISDTAPNINQQFDIINGAKGFIEYCCQGQSGCNGRAITEASEYCVQVVDELKSRALKMVDTIEEYNNASWWQQDLASLGMGATKIFEGIGTLGENIIDCGATLVGFTTGWINEDWKHGVENFIAKDHVGDFFYDQYESGLLSEINALSNFSHTSTAASIFEISGTIAAYAVMDSFTCGTASIILNGAAGVGRKTQESLQKGDDLYTAALKGGVEGVKDAAITYGFQKLDKALGATKSVDKSDDVFLLTDKADDTVKAIGTTKNVDKADDAVKAIGTTKNADKADDAVKALGTTKNADKADDVAKAADKVGDAANSSKKADDILKGKADDYDWYNNLDKNNNVIGRVKVDKKTGKVIDIENGVDVNGNIIGANPKSASKFSKAKDGISNATSNVKQKINNATDAFKTSVGNSKVANAAKSAQQKVTNVAKKVGDSKVANAIKNNGAVQGVGTVAKKAGTFAVNHPKTTKVIGTAIAYNEQKKAQNASEQFKKTNDSNSIIIDLNDSKKKLNDDAVTTLGEIDTSYKPKKDTTPISTPSNGNKEKPSSNPTQQPTNANSTPTNTGGGSSHSGGGSYSRSSSTGGNSGGGYTPTINTPTNAGNSAQQFTNKDTGDSKKELKEVNVGKITTGRDPSADLKKPEKPSMTPTGPTPNPEPPKPTPPTDSTTTQTPTPPSNNSNTNTVITPPSNPGTGQTTQHTGGGYSGSGGYRGYTGGGNSGTEAAASTITETATPSTVEDVISNSKTSIDDVIKGSKYTKIPTSSKPITTTSRSSGSTVIPVVAGLSAAAAAGIGAKVYMDRKKNNENGEYDEIDTEEWTGEDSLNLSYDDSSDTEAYLDDDDDYSYQREEQTERYDARNNEELADLQ